MLGAYPPGQPADLRYGAYKVERGAASCHLTRDPLNRTAADANLLGDRQHALIWPLFEPDT
jgi:hypothetical protein